jgi:hypothetical protein
MKQNLFRALVLSAFLLPWTTLLSAAESAAERPYVHALFFDNLVLHRNCAVQFTWDSNPDYNLRNSEALPAVPLRIDDWPGITKDRR